MTIGVFDSGSGGLTIMRALDKAFPDRPFIYLGDHANAPYGKKSADEIYALTIQNVERLFTMGCGLVIIACNTAAARGLRKLQREWLPHYYPERRVLGVIVPVVEEMTGMLWTPDQEPIDRVHDRDDLHVAVFATQHTVESGAFSSEIHKRAPHIQVTEQACPNLVDLIENNASETLLRNAVKDYVDALYKKVPGQKLDMCILACTHYPLIEDIFRRALPAGTRILSQPDITSKSLVSYLERHPELKGETGDTRLFLTTGNTQQASLIASRFYGHVVDFELAQ